MSSTYRRSPPPTCALAVLLAVAAAASTATTTRSERDGREGKSAGEASPAAPAASCKAVLHADAVADPGLGLLQRAGAKEIGKLGSRTRRRGAARVQSPQLPVLAAVRRTLYSSDPQATADFVLRYFIGARSVPVQSFSAFGGAACLDAAAVELSWNGQTMGMLFVHDRVKPEGPVSIDAFVNSSDRAWDTVMARHQRYSPWVDFHDGLPSQLLNITRLAWDGVPFQMYLRYVNRLNVPHTAWTIEFVETISAVTGPILPSAMEAMYWDDQAYVDPDYCRNNELVDDDLMWWKSTFAALDPVAAVNFAVEVLGARRIESPYPWPKQENCTAALWVELPATEGHASGFEMHFVESPEFPPGRPSIRQFNAYQARFRTSRSTQFDRYLYNSLVLAADDLDPFVAKLQSLGAAFLALRLQPGAFALVFSFPRNDAVVVEIQGPRLTAVEAVDFEPCSER